MPPMPSDQIRYQLGVPMHFISTRNFSLGVINGQPYNLSKGTDIFFDGTTVDVAGSRFPLPQLRGAVRTGWLVPAAVYDENDMSAERPRVAGIQVRHAADGGNPLRPNQANFARATEEDIDEREVGDVNNHARQTRDRNASRRERRPRDPNVQPGRRYTGSIWQVEPQDGVEVRSGFATADSAGESARNIPPSRIDYSGEVIARADRVQIQPGEGVTEEQMLEGMDPQDREEYLAEKEAYRSRYVQVAPVQRTIIADPSPHRVVGRVANHGAETREGIRTQLSTGNGIDAIDLSGYDAAPARQGVVTQEGMTFRTTNGPEREIQPTARGDAGSSGAQVVRTVGQNVTMREAPADIRRMVAKQVCPDFPDNYDFGGSPRKRLARLQADYEDRVDVLRAVFAAEGDEMKNMLVAEFPHAFQQS